MVTSRILKYGLVAIIASVLSTAEARPKKDKGKGPVSTVLITNGNLEKGNYFVCGNTWGKIRAMIDDKGQNIDLAAPSTPVEILGMNGSALAGDDFAVVESEKKAKEINEYRVKDNSIIFLTLVSSLINF